MPAANKKEQVIEILTWPGVVESARQLDLSLGRVYNLVWTGRLVGLKIGGQWRISPDAIAAYRARREQV